MSNIKALVLCFFLVITSLFAHSQVSGDIYSRTLLISTPVGRGTAFIVDIENRQYVITAAHMVTGLGDSNQVSFLLNHDWKSLPFRIYRCKEPVDIAVLVPEQLLTRNPMMSIASPSKIYFGQELLFVGFPFGWSMQFTNLSPNPIALVKRGALSATVDQGGAQVMLIDGHNNFGFSGGPVVYHELGKPGYELAVTAVVSGFHPELRPVVKKEPLKPGESLDNLESWRRSADDRGNPVKLVDTGEFVPVNTGFLLAYDIKYALDLIAEHPVGPKTK